MIAGCIARMRQDSCRGCDRRDDCAFVWPEALGFALRAARPSAGAGESPPRPRNPFIAFLGEIARAVDNRSKPRPDSFRRDVERQVEPMLATGSVGIDQVARALGYSRQTLYRRLKAEGITFAALLDGLRRRLALRLVVDQGLPVKEAAYRLGFSDPAAFSRAFKRWTGKSPGEMRGRAH
ncbi:MAG TPA: helix-turn-helix transcriptional regulator [Allosphingosinicella sp.]|nr:helix-turn-helix transcriptional regulator [Allosphingosinicella sp.]